MSASTLEAILYDLRLQGADVLFDDTNQVRLRELNARELAELRERLKKWGVREDTIDAICPAPDDGKNRQIADGGGSCDDWDSPDWSILDDRRGELPEFPIDVFSPPCQDWLVRAAHGAGVTTGHVAVPLIAVASSLIGTARRIQASRSWSQPLTMWTALIGFSGTGKTPGLDVTRRVLSHIARDRKNKVADLRRAHETRVQAAKEAEKSWKDQVKQALADGGQPPLKPGEAIVPGEFVTPRLHVSDVTIERIAVLIQARPRGMLFIRDELSALFVNMERNSNGSDKEFWLEAWNGEHYVVERMGRPPVEIDHLLVGVTGGFQPDKLVRSFVGDDDGMYARFCFAWPPEPDYQKLTDSVAEIEPEIINAISRLADLGAGHSEDGSFAPKAIPLCPEARERFEQFRQFLHSHKREFDGREREWWAKGPAHVLRLTGTLVYLDWSMSSGKEPEEIEAKFVNAAVQLVREHFWPHSRAALRQTGLSDRHANARRVLRWVRANRKTEVSREDIRRDALGQKLDADQTQQLMKSLERAGWVRAVQTFSGPKGGRRALRWTVNPILLSDGAGIAQTAQSSPMSFGETGFRSSRTFRSNADVRSTEATARSESANEQFPPCQPASIPKPQGTPRWRGRI